MEPRLLGRGKAEVERLRSDRDCELQWSRAC